MSWILLVAVFLATLNPAWGSVFRSAGHAGAHTIEVPLCHGNETILVTLDPADSPAHTDGDTTGRHAGHCVLCLYPSFSPGHDPVMPAVALAAALHVSLPDTSPGPRARAWNVPLARAPPFQS